MIRNPSDKAARPKLVASRFRIAVDVEDQLAGLLTLDIAALRERWTTLLGTGPVKCQSKDVLRGLLAWRIQARRYGGLTRDAKRRLVQLAPTSGIDKPSIAPTVTLRTGTMLTKEWRGVMHRVHVLERGYAYDGKTYASLSAVARRIAGTRWSGPRFFGLEAKRPAASRADQ